MKKKLSTIDKIESRERHVVDDVPVVVYRYDGEIYVYRDLCPHAAARLSDGGFREEKPQDREWGRSHEENENENQDGCKGVVRCPKHGAEFDVETGEPLSFPADDDLTEIDSETEKGTVYVYPD